MADNLTLNAGAGGATLATDDIGGVHYQIQKLAYGALDSATLVDTTNRMPTAAAQNGTWNITNVSGTVSLPTGASTAAKQPALGTAGTASADVITVQGIASMTALKIDGSGVTQPVSGTFWQATQPVSNAGTFAVQAAQSGAWNITNVSGTVSLPTGAATAAKQPALGSAGTAATDVLTIQGIAGMTKLLVTPDSVALPANQSVNVSQLAGTTTDTNSGVKSAGTLRVVLATDQPQLTNKLLVTPDANSAINVAQVNGVTPLMGNGVTGTGSPRVTIASDNTAFSVNATVKAGTSGGWTHWSTPKDNSNTALTTTVVTVKGSAGQLGGYMIYNPNASAAYVQVFDVSGAVTLGTTRPDMVIAIPATSAANLDSAAGVAFANAIKIAAATTDSGSSALGSGLTVTLWYA